MPGERTYIKHTRCPNPFEVIVGYVMWTGIPCDIKRAAVDGHLGFCSCALLGLGFQARDGEGTSRLDDDGSMPMCWSRCRRASIPVNDLLSGERRRQGAFTAERADLVYGR